MENDGRMTDTRTLTPLPKLKAFNAAIGKMVISAANRGNKEKTAAVLRKALSAGSFSCGLLQPLPRFADLIVFAIFVVVGIVFLWLGSRCIHRSAARTKYILSLRKPRCTRWKLATRC